MLGITDLGVFIAGTIAIVLLPGPNSLYVLTVASRSGIKRGYAGALGIFLGDSILMLLTAAGAASVLQANPLLFTLLRWAGAIYLAFLGGKLLFGAYQTMRQLKSPASLAMQEVLASLQTPIEKTASAVSRRALLISLLNPKAILFFLSFFVQFVDPAYEHAGLSFLLLGIIVQIASLTYLSILIVGGARLSQAFSGRKRLAAIFNSLVGLLFIGFGLRLTA